MFHSLPFAALVSLITQTLATPVPAPEEASANVAFDYVVVGGGTFQTPQNPPIVDDLPLT